MAHEIVVRASDLKYKILRQKYENLKKQGNFGSNSRNSVNSLHSSFDVNDDDHFSPSVGISPSVRTSLSPRTFTLPPPPIIFNPSFVKSSLSPPHSHTPPQNPRLKKLEILIDHYIDMDIKQSIDMSKNQSTLVYASSSNGDDKGISVDSIVRDDKLQNICKGAYIDNYVGDSNRNVGNRQSPSSIACILKTPNHSGNYDNKNIFNDDNNKNVFVDSNNDNRDDNAEPIDISDTTQDSSIFNSNNSSIHRYSESSPPLYSLTVPTHTPHVRTSPSLRKSPSICTVNPNLTMPHLVRNNEDIHTNKLNMKSSPQNTITFPLTYTTKHPYPIPKIPATPLDLGTTLASISSGIKSDQKNVRRKRVNAEKPNNKRWSI